MNSKLVIPFLLLASGCTSEISTTKTPFHSAVEECLSQTRLGDGHTNQDINRCVSQSDGMCGEPREFQSAFGERLNYDFAKASYLRCTKSDGQQHEACDINIWTKIIAADSSNADNPYPREEGEFKVQCLKLPTGKQSGSFYEVS